MTFLLEWRTGRMLAVGALLGMALQAPAHSADRQPLKLETKIPLGKVVGRIDHLAFDARRARLYVAELGNNSVGIVDLRQHRLIRTVTGFEAPQGIGYDPSTDAVYVANAGDGSVRVFSGSDFAALGVIALGEDADNIRIDRVAHRVYVGYGDGALAVIDPAARKRIADIPLKGHPESFQLDPAGSRVFVNVPDAREIAIVARDSSRQISGWPTDGLHANFPLAVDIDHGRVLSIFRRPSRLQAYEMNSGRKLGGTGVCADSDDIFVDARRRRIYVICGDGHVDVLDSSGDAYGHIGRVATSAGSRTGLFVPEIDRLIVAIRAAGHESAAVWLLRPEP